MMDAGFPEPEPSQRHILTNCLGGTEKDVKIEFNHVMLQDRDRLLFCTDGLTDMVADAEIASTLALHADPQAACQALVDRALECGGKDNVTVVVANFALPADAT
jgi:PPM family protein phosphatase